jgi:hypothetical protein
VRAGVRVAVGTAVAVNVRARPAAHRGEPLLATPPEIARTLPRQAQELLGYAAHDALAHGGGSLGALDLRDPVEMLADGTL